MMENKKQLKIYNNRYIENKYTDLDSSANIINDEIVPMISKNLEKIVSDFISNSAIEEDYVLDSLGEKEFNYSIYTGTGSITYIFWRYYLLCKEQKYGNLEEAFSLFKFSIEKNISIYKNIKMKKKSPSFFMSEVGIYTMGCIFYTLAEDESNFNSSLGVVLENKELAVNNNTEYELLYGAAGYLYSLLLIKDHCEKYLTIELKNQINANLLEVLIHLYKSGVSSMSHYKSEFLVWPWPKTKTRSLSDVYLGAAHGAIGILYMMVKSLQSLGIYSDTNDKNLKQIVLEIDSSLTNLAKIRFKSGNFPSSYGKEKDSLVHFCHGETGAIPLYILAYEYFNKEEYLEVAISSGEDLWKRGLLLKGNGICHGISGGAYSLFSIYRRTEDTKWKTRAFLFAKATLDEDIQNICRNYEDPQRITKGLPDSPFSLMEGLGGVITLLSDFMNREEFIKFPGYEI